MNLTFGEILIVVFAVFILNWFLIQKGGDWLVKKIERALRYHKI